MIITNYSKNGVPILTNDEIDKHAYYLLDLFDKKIIADVKPTPVTSLAEFLKAKYNLSYKLMLLPEINNSKILGKTNLQEGLISIDSSLIHDEKRYNFTFSHEIGHFWLHRHREIKFDEDNKSIEDVIDDQVNLNIFYKNRSEIKPRDWLEMHANKFAASLLMPEVSFKKALQYFQSEHLDIKKNIGKIIINDELDADYNKIIALLSDHFLTPKISITYRLEYFNIVSKKHGVKHISELFKQ